MSTPDRAELEKAKETCCGEPMVENGNGTGLRCSKKCGFWVAKPPFIKLEIVNGYGIQRGHRAVLFDDTRITPVKVSPNQVEESWAIDAHDLLDNPAIAQLLADEKARVWRKAEDEEIVCSKHKDWPSKEMPMYKVGCEDCQFVRGYNSKRLEITQAALADGVDLDAKSE